MITHYFRTLKDSELKQLETVRTGIWTHVVNPTPEELVFLKQEFALDELMLDDATDFFEVPRFEREGSVAYFFVRYPFDEKTEDIDTAPLMIALGESFVVTFAQREVPFLKPFINGKKEIHTTQKTKFLIQIMDALTKAYEVELTRMRKVVYRDRTRVRNIKARDIQRLVSFEHELNDTLSALVPMSAEIKMIMGGNQLQLFSEDVELLEDLNIDNAQLIDSAKSILKTIQNIRSASEAILTQQLNHTIRMLTALTILLTIPTILSSLYGMNVPLPFADSDMAFYGVLGTIVVLFSFGIYYFRRNNWL